MKKIIFSLVLSLLLAPKAMAECSLSRPGPFLKEFKGKQYKKIVTEDSSEESLILSPEKTLLVNTYGCEDNWGWDIKLELNGNSERAKTLADAFELIRGSLSQFQTKKISEYNIEKHLQNFADKIDPSKFKKAGANQNEMICTRMAVLSRKECAETLRLESKNTRNKQILHFEFRDLEN